MVILLNLSSVVLTASLPLTTKASAGTCAEPVNSSKMINERARKSSYPPTHLPGDCRRRPFQRLSLVTDDFDLTFSAPQRFHGPGDGAERMDSVDISAGSPRRSSFRFSRRMNSSRP